VQGHSTEPIEATKVAETASDSLKVTAQNVKQKIGFLPGFNY